MKRGMGKRGKAGERFMSARTSKREYEDGRKIEGRRMGEREQCPYAGRECNVQECDSCYAAREAIEYAIQCELAEHYDENGDPYRDFEGNPW